MTRKKVLLLTGGLYHPFEAAADILHDVLTNKGKYEVHTEHDRDCLLRDSLDAFDAAMSYVCAGELTREQETGLTEFVSAGHPYIGLHGATTIRGEHPDYDQMLGGRFVAHPPVGEFMVTIADPEHPITQGVTDFVITDELYILDKFDPAESHVLATANLEGKTHPVAYTKKYGRGRVFYLALGHDQQALGHPEFQKMLVRGMDWSISQHCT